MVVVVVVVVAAVGVTAGAQSQGPQLRSSLLLAGSEQGGVEVLSHYKSKDRHQAWECKARSLACLLMGVQVLRRPY